MDALNLIAQAAERVGRLEPQLDRARQDLHASILEAHRQGVSVAVIARVAGLSPQRIRQLVGRKPR